MIEKTDATNIVNDTNTSTKTVMRTIRERLTNLDNDEFVQDLNNDLNNINDNKTADV